MLRSIIIFVVLFIACSYCLSQFSSTKMAIYLSHSFQIHDPWPLLDFRNHDPEFQMLIAFLLWIFVVLEECTFSASGCNSCRVDRATNLRFRSFVRQRFCGAEAASNTKPYLPSVNGFVELSSFQHKTVPAATCSTGCSTPSLLHDVGAPHCALSQQSNLLLEEVIWGTSYPTQSGCAFIRFPPIWFIFYPSLGLIFLREQFKVSCQTRSSRQSHY